MTCFHFRIKGTGLPKFVAKEDLAKIVVDLADKVGVPMERRDIAKVRRNYKKTAIIAHFTSNVMGSPMFLLQSREVSGKADELHLIFLPLLTHHDEAINWKARNLVKDGKIFGSWVSSKSHVVMIQKEENSKPIQVFEEADLEDL